MNLTVEKLNKQSSIHVEALYRRSFPTRERIPFWVLDLLDRNGMITIRVYRASGKLCGFTCSVEGEELVYLLYFAINEQYRNQGYGSVILQSFLQYHGDRIVVTSVEPLDQLADNYSQRYRRVQFYINNGLQMTDHMIREGTDFYWLMSTKPFTKGQFRKTMEKPSFGLYEPEIYYHD